MRRRTSESSLLTIGVLGEKEKNRGGTDSESVGRLAFRGMFRFALRELRGDRTKKKHVFVNEGSQFRQDGLPLGSPRRYCQGAEFPDAFFVGRTRHHRKMPCVVKPAL
jgi:hypothetical protein